MDNNFFISLAEKLSDEKKNIRERYSIKEKSVVILFLGKLVDFKRPFDLLRAFHRIATPDTSLVFVGSGDQEQILKKYIQSHELQNVRLVGFKNQTEIPEFYAMSDIFVVPSSKEMWGLVVNEAMCFQLPLILSDVVGSGADLLQEGVNGYKYESGNIEDLSRCLLKLIHDEKMRISFGKKSFDIIQNYTLEKNVEAIRLALQKCIT